MNKEVYINGQLVDLDERNNPIQLTYAVNDLAELKDRQAYSTNTFKLPITARNLEICGFPNDANFIQAQPYRKNTAKIVQGGIEIITNGIAIITKANKAIEVQILSGLVGFFDLLEDKSIRDLDLSEWDHFWNLNTVIASQYNDVGYVYSIIDYGGLDDVQKRVDARQLRPATFRKTIIEKIIAEAGYTATGSYKQLDKYQKAIIPFTNDKFEHGQSFIDAASDISASARKNVPQQLANDFRDFVISFEDDSTTDPGNRWNGTEYTAPDVVKIHVTFKYALDIRDQYKGGSVPSLTFRIQVYKGGQWVNTDFSNQNMAVGEFETYTYPDQEIVGDVDLNPGDKIRIIARSEPAEDRVLGVVHAGATIKLEYVAGDVIYGQKVQLAASLPDISQKDFFKDFLQNFGLIVIPDNYRKTLLLINMSDVYANKPIAQDITDRLIQSNDNITYSLSGYGIENKGKYKSDDAVPDGLGDGSMILDNQTLNQSVDLFTSKFAASSKSVKMGGIAVTEIKKIADPTKSTDFTVKTEPRILYHKRLNTQLEIFDATGSQLVNLISLPVFDGLDYNTLFEENYAEIKRMLYRPFIVVKDILLSETDIAEIDWRIPVYDKRSASYYYKNQISYIQGDVSSISLIKLP